MLIYIKYIIHPYKPFPRLLWGKNWKCSALPLLPQLFLVSLFFSSIFPNCTYRKVASRSTCYYSENQVFGGATNRDMSLNETCYYSKIQKFWTLKSQLVTCPKGYLFAWILIKILLCLDFKSFFAWILASFFWFQKPSLYGFQKSSLHGFQNPSLLAF